MNIEDSVSTNLNSAQSNVPYTESYNESNMLLEAQYIKLIILILIYKVN